MSIAQPDLPGAALSAGSVAQVLFGLVLVLALVGAVAWLLKRLSAFRAPGAGLIRVLAGAAVGQRERIVLVEVGETWLLVGVAPGHVTTLHTMPKLASASPPGVPTPATVGASFATWLSRKMEGRSHD
jgi:flagellar protein FliO/FliZ